MAWASLLPLFLHLLVHEMCKPAEFLSSNLSRGTREPTTTCHPDPQVALLRGLWRRDLLFLPSPCPNNASPQLLFATQP
jgi:hypothetical protein